MDGVGNIMFSVSHETGPQSFQKRVLYRVRSKILSFSLQHFLFDLKSFICY